MQPIRYDASRDALYRPQTRPPLDMGGSGWALDARCAELSRLAYFAFEREQAACDAVKAALASAGLGNMVVFENPGTNTQAFGATASDGTAFIAYRGTQPGWFDLATDAAFLPSAWQGKAKVHGGFKRAFDSVQLGERGIATWLAGVGHPPLVATGHSLGAALATLLAARHIDGGKIAELVTFGSPRVGNAAFAARLGAVVARRYVNCCDAVTGVPYEWMGFRHLGVLHYLDRNGIARGDPGAEVIAADRREARNDYLAQYWLKWRSVKARELADHAPINYVSAVLGARSG